MDNDKSPGNDGITKEFYIKFWDIVKESLCASIQQSFIAGEYCTPQKQAIIKLIEKKDRGKRFIKNWRPISLLNVDMKLVSKVLASRLKSVISSIVNQVAYVNNRFISESGRLISDVLEITNSLDTEGLLMTADIEKAFDPINHSFLMCVLKKIWVWQRISKLYDAKCEIIGIGVRKGVKMALCGMDCIDLTEDVINILGIYFSYNKKLEQEKNFLNHVVKIQNILKLWKLRSLTIEGRIIVFKSLAIYI